MRSGLRPAASARVRSYYNNARPHRALGRRTPAQAYAARPKAQPRLPKIDTAHWRTRRDTIDKSGTVTLRHNSRLHHIGVGRPHVGTKVLILAHDRNIRIIDRNTGELLRDLVLDPTKDYQSRPTT